MRCELVSLEILVPHAVDPRRHLQGLDGGRRRAGLGVVGVLALGVLGEVSGLGVLAARAGEAGDDLSTVGGLVATVIRDLSAGADGQVGHDGRADHLLESRGNGLAVVVVARMRGRRTVVLVLLDLIAGNNLVDLASRGGGGLSVRGLAVLVLLVAVLMLAAVLAVLVLATVLAVLMLVTVILNIHINLITGNDLASLASRRGSSVGISRLAVLMLLVAVLAVLMLSAVLVLTTVLAVLVLAIVVLNIHIDLVAGNDLVGLGLASRRRSSVGVSRLAVLVLLVAVLAVLVLVAVLMLTTVLVLTTVLAVLVLAIVVLNVHIDLVAGNDLIGFALALSVSRLSILVLAALLVLAAVLAVLVLATVLATVLAVLMLVTVVLDVHIDLIASDDVVGGGRGSTGASGAVVLVAGPYTRGAAAVGAAVAVAVVTVVAVLLDLGVELLVDLGVEHLVDLVAGMDSLGGSRLGVGGLRLSGLGMGGLDSGLRVLSRLRVLGRLRVLDSRVRVLGGVRVLDGRVRVLSSTGTAMLLGAALMLHGRLGGHSLRSRGDVSVSRGLGVVGVLGRVRVDGAGNDALGVGGLSRLSQGKGAQKAGDAERDLGQLHGDGPADCLKLGSGSESDDDAADDEKTIPWLEECSLFIREHHACELGLSLMKSEICVGSLSGSRRERGARRAAATPSSTRFDCLWRCPSGVASIVDDEFRRSDNRPCMARALLRPTGRPCAPGDRFVF